MPFRPRLAIGATLLVVVGTVVSGQTGRPLAGTRLIAAAAIAKRKGRPRNSAAGRTRRGIREHAAEHSPARRAAAPLEARPDSWGSESGPPQESSVNRYRELMAVRGQQLSNEVTAAIAEARRSGATDPDSAIALLKREQGIVTTAGDIEPQVRDELSRRLMNTIQELRSIKEHQQINRLNNAERLAQVEARRKSLEQMSLEETRLTELIDQCRALLVQAVHGDDNAYEQAEAVAREAINLRPGNGPATQALVNLDGWRTVEQGVPAEKPAGRSAPRNSLPGRVVPRPVPGRAAHPVAQCPSLAGPDRAAEEMGASRSSLGEQTRAADQRGARSAGRFQYRASIAERRARLYRDPLLRFPSCPTPRRSKTPTSTCRPRFTGAIRESSCATCSSCLLEQMSQPLTYVIEDEVLKITTVDKANEKLSIRMYPVGDLIMGPQQLQALAGAGGGGGSRRPARRPGRRWAGRRVGWGWWRLGRRWNGRRRNVQRTQRAAVCDRTHPGSEADPVRRGRG